MLQGVLAIPQNIRRLGVVDQESVVTRWNARRIKVAHFARRQRLRIDPPPESVIGGSHQEPLGILHVLGRCRHDREPVPGLAVALFVELLNYSSVMASQSGGGPPNFDHPDGIESRLSKEYLAAVPQIAKFAERYKVDWFDPANEADKGFTAANAARIVKAAPKRAKSFKGLLVTQPLVTTYEEAGIVPDMSGYDLVSLHDGDILREAQNYEQTGQLSDRLFAQSETAWAWAQASGVTRYLVGEFGQFDAVTPAPSVAATSAVVDAYLAKFPNPQGLFCQDNPDPSMDRFETSPMNAVCKSLQSRF